MEIEANKARDQAIAQQREELLLKLKAIPLEDQERTNTILGEIALIDKKIADNKKPSSAEVNMRQQVVRNGKVFKKVQVVTLIQDSFSIQTDVMQRAMNNINEVIRRLSITES